MIDARKVAEELKARSRKVVVAPSSNMPFEIRKLRPSDFMRCIEIAAKLEIPGGPVLTSEERPSAVKAALEKSEEYQRAFLGVVFKGILAPRVLLDDDAVAGEGEINAFDVPQSDLNWLVAQVVEWSGLGTEAEAIEFFRAQAAPDARDARPDGEAVRADAPRVD